jgi:hypothetical protein
MSGQRGKSSSVAVSEATTLDLAPEKYPHDEPIEGFEKQPTSEDVIFVNAYFGSERFLTYFEDRLKDIARYYSNSHIATINSFIPLLGMIPDNLFVKVMGSSLWTSIHVAVGKCTSESNFTIIDRLIAVIAERQKLSQPAHSVLIKLVTHNSSSRYIGRFAARLADITDLSSDLSTVVSAFHSFFACLTGADWTRTVAAYIPRILSGLQQFPDIRLAPDVTNAAEVTCKQFDVDTMCMVVDYLLQVMRMNPAFQSDMIHAIKARIAKRSRYSANSISILLLDRLVLADGNLDEDAVYRELTSNHESFLAMDADGYQGELWKLYRSWIGHSLTKTKKRFVRKTFAKAKVAVPEEKEFFVMSLKMLEGRDVDHVIEGTCMSVEKYDTRPTTVIPARRALLLAADVWPERKAASVRMVGERITETFPKGIKNWAEITALFNP